MTIRNDASRTRIATREKRRPRAVVARQGQVLLDTDVDQQSRHHLERLEIETLDSLGSPGRLLVPAGNNGFKITPDGATANFDIGQGRGYLDGWLLENPSVFKLTTQPHPRTGDSVNTPAVIALKALVRHIDPVEEPVLADVALGDAQASGRSLVDWQVFPSPITTGGIINCSTILTNFSWLALIAPSTGTLAVIEQPAGVSTDPCSLTPGGGYTRLENLLYRFEVHGGDVSLNTPEGPRFNLHSLKIKFSRRNASVMARIKTITNTEITVAPPALDPRNWFAPGQYAEIVSIHDDVDPRAALANERLFAVAQASDDRVTLQATAGQIAATGATGDGTWFLRLWDAFPGGNGVAIVSAPNNAATSAEIDLGDGLKIKLATGTTSVAFRRGDYWNCAARADGTTDWPKTANIGDPMTPHGPAIRYAPLAVVTAGTTTPFEDCRIPFATLSDRSLLYRGGDGQSVFAPAGSGMLALPAKARVAVMRGETPVVGATVRWTVLGPASLIDGTLLNPGASMETTSGPDGLASVTWSIDSGKPLETHQIQAALVGPAAAAIEPPLVFTAVFETAAHTGYTPGACSHLSGVDNVQTALDVLCSKIGQDDTQSLTLTSITLLDQKGVATELIQKETLILNALEVRFNSFVSGIAFGIDGGVPDIKIRDFDPVVEIELDLPYPTTDPDRLYWLEASGSQIPSFFGFQRVRLDGTVELMPKPPAGGIKPGLIWKPSKTAAQFIESAGRHLWGQQINQDAAARLKELGWQFATPFGRILCRIRLRSALIFVGNEKQRVYLNAEHLGVAGSVTERELLVKQRDPQRAGDLDIFIYLSNEAIKVVKPTGAVGKTKTGRLRRGAVDKKSLAPFLPTPQSLVVEMLKLGQLKRGERMVDVGSGDGRIVITAAREFGADATGFEFDKELWQKTSQEIKRLKLQKSARTVLGDATTRDVSRADLVTLYLVPEGNERIRTMLEKQLKPGARVVSHDYEIAGWYPARTERVQAEDGRAHTLFAYTR